MDELTKLYKKYNNGEYDIADVSRILSYIALSDELDEDINKAEYTLENIRFLRSKDEQNKEVNAILVELIEKVKRLKKIDT